MSLAHPTEARSETLAYSPGSPWMALLWRDLRQQAAGIAILSALTLLLSSWRLVLWLLLLDIEAIPASGVVYLLFGSLPVLSAALSAALLFGNEMDGRAWNWANTLPIRPRQALLLRVGSAATIAGFFVVLGWLLAWGTGFGRLDQVSWLPPAHLLLVALKYWIVTFGCFSIAILVFRDTLASLLVGAVVLLAVESVLPTVYFDAISLRATSLQYDSFQVLGGVLALAESGLVAWGLFCLHERAWYRRDPLFNWERWKERMGQPAGLRWLGMRRGTSRVRPRLSYALIWSVVRQDWLLRAVGVAAVLSISLLVLRRRDGNLNFDTFLLSVIPGVLAFAGDQRKDRFRFLANRGVPVGGVMGSRILVALATILPPMAILIGLFVRDLMNGRENSFLGELPAITFLFLTAILAGICFRSITLAVISCGGALPLWFAFDAAVPQCGGFSMESAVKFLYHRLFDSGVGMDTGLWMLLLLGLALMVAFLAVLYRMVRRWLVLDRPGLVRRFAVVVPLLALSIIGWGQWAMLASFPSVPRSAQHFGEALPVGERVLLTSICRPEGAELPEPLSEDQIGLMVEVCSRREMELKGRRRVVSELPGEVTSIVRNEKIMQLKKEVFSRMPGWKNCLEWGLKAADPAIGADWDRQLVFSGVFLVSQGEREEGLACLEMAGKLRRSTPLLYLIRNSVNDRILFTSLTMELLPGAVEAELARLKELVDSLYPDTKLAKRLMVELFDLNRQENDAGLNALFRVEQYRNAGANRMENMGWLARMVSEKELDLLRLKMLLLLDLQDSGAIFRPDRNRFQQSMKFRQMLYGSDSESRLARTVYKWSRFHFARNLENSGYRLLRLHQDRRAIELAFESPFRLTR